MTLDEGSTRRELVDPALAATGWTPGQVEREYRYSAGRVRLVGDHAARDAARRIDYVLRDQPGGMAIAVIEAKAASAPASKGLQQAIAYAQDLDVPFAYATNGRAFVERDMLTGEEREIAEFPGPAELVARRRASATLFAGEVTNRRGERVANPLLRPGPTIGDGRTLRYYQEAAVKAALGEMVKGRHRALLALATGTGKTFIANNVAWRAKESGWAHKILFLVDRRSLMFQAYRDFVDFGDARAIVSDGAPPLNRDIHFATYQQLYSRRDAEQVFAAYPENYFDLIIVDECHRSGYGDWSVILERFASAFHLGLTATPKRDDTIDTYAFFASENLDEDGQPASAFEYSLGHGIQDGFLATFLVNRVLVNTDLDGLDVREEVERGADLLVPDGAHVQDVYQAEAFEREILVPDRTRLMCEHLAGKLLEWGPRHKTIVFCVTAEHASQVRSELQRLLGGQTGMKDYAVRIVAEEPAAQQLLERFRDPNDDEPALATTVDFLSTGIDLPALRTIVFMKPVSSPTAFKQIVGRGTRVDDRTGKLFFRIVDYTNATRLFDAWDLPGLPSQADDDVDGHDGVLTGDVTSSDGNGLPGATVQVRLGGRAVAETSTGPSGEFELRQLPEGLVTVEAVSRGFTRRSTPIDLRGEREQHIALTLREKGERTSRLQIDGIDVLVVEDAEVSVEVKGQRMSPSEYRAHAGQSIRTLTGEDPQRLRTEWAEPGTRASLKKALREEDVVPAALAVSIDRPDVDEYDLAAFSAYDEPLRPRESRVRDLQGRLGAGSLPEGAPSWIATLTPQQEQVVRALLDRYRAAGLGELDSADVFTLNIFDDFGGARGVEEILGSTQNIRELVAWMRRALVDLED